VGGGYLGARGMNGNFCMLSSGQFPGVSIQTSGNYPEESIQHTEHGESLKSRLLEIV